MQRQGRMLIGHLRGARSLTHRGARWHQASHTACRELGTAGETAVEAVTASASNAAPTHLHSVVSAQDGDNAFASVTVTFGPPTGASTSHHAAASGEAVVPAAQHAAKVALLALRGALGSSRPPSALLAFTSIELPRPAVTALAAALTESLRGDGSAGGDVGSSGATATPLIGCSSRLRLPEERRATAASTGGPAVIGAADSEAAANGGGDAGAAAETSGEASSPPYHYHVTLAGAHLPGHEVHAVRCDTSSLPRLPYLADCIAGRRAPSFLMLADGDSLAAELLNRLENLFPGSCVGAGVATQQALRSRRLMLVGPSGGGGGGGAFGRGEVFTGGAGPAGEAGGAGGAFEAAGTSGRPGADEDPFLAAAVAAAATRGRGGSAASELEGPFQRMLLDRDGSGSGGGADGAASSSSSSSSGAGRRRRLPPSAASAANVDGGAAAASSGQAGDADGGGASAAAAAASSDDAAAEALAASLESFTPPFVFIGNQLHHSGGALLTLYPRAAASAGAAAAAGGASSSTAGRLSAASCDLLARIALGTDHLHHVALRGAALSAISPPPTGPEPAAPQPAAHDNPYYWWPAAAAHPAVAVDPHLDAKADSDPESDDAHARTTSSEHCGAAADGPAVHDDDDAAARLAEATEAVQEAVAALVGSSGGSGGAAAGGEDAAPSSAALSAMTDGLRELPLFPLEGAILFPGQTMQVRVFEKRYRALMRAVTEQGAAFGLCWRGMGTTAVVRSYQSAPGGSGDMLVLLEGGMRFSYGTEDLGVVPASYGINVARRAEYVLDELPTRQEDLEAMLAAARGIIDALASHLEAATSSSVQQSARTFANALHFASSQQPPNPPPSQQAPAAATTTAAAAAAAGETASDDEAGAAAADGGDDDAALLAGDLADAKAGLEPETASLLSLYLAPHIPVHLESLRRGWFTSRDALWRLQQEAAWLRGSPRVCMAVASSVLRLPREHPLRIMLGLSRVAPVG